MGYKQNEKEDFKVDDIFIVIDKKADTYLDIGIVTNINRYSDGDILSYDVEIKHKDNVYKS